MDYISFFDEQNRRKRHTVFYLILGVAWMAIMGWLVVAANAPLLRIIEVSEQSIRDWTYISCIGTVLLWALLTLFVLSGSNRFLPVLLGAREAAGVDETDLAHAVECLPLAACEGATPRYYIIETGAMNAFACGNSIQNGTIIVTRGLMQNLTKSELSAVVAHEIAHLKNGDTRFIVAALAFAWIVVGTAIVAGALACLVGCAMGLTFYIFLKIMELVGGDEGTGLIFLIVILAAVGLLIYGLVLLAAYALAAAIVFGVLMMGVKAVSSAISQSREYLADACAAQWTRDPVAVASALNKVGAASGVAGFGSSLIAPLWLETARSNAFADFLMRTHPDMAGRIERLTKMAGSRVVTDAEWLAEIRPTWQSRMEEWLWPASSTLMAGGLVVALGAWHFREGNEGPWLEHQRMTTMPTAPTNATAPANPPKTTLSIQNYLAAKLTAEANGNIEEIMRGYAPRVDYRDRGWVGRDAIRSDKLSYYREWPKRSEELLSIVSWETIGIGRHRLVYRARFQVQSPAGKLTRSGVYEATLLLEDSGYGSQIVSDKGIVLRSDKEPRRPLREEKGVRQKVVESSSTRELAQNPGEKYPQTRLKVIKWQDLEGYSENMVRHAINEMYARHGANFGKEEVRRQFLKFEWYRPRPGVTFDQIEAQEFSEIEKLNLKLLAEYRDGLGKKQTSSLTDEKSRTKMKESQRRPLIPERASSGRRRDEFDDLDRY